MNPEIGSRRDVLIFSKRLAGGVRKVAQILEGLGRQPVLVSALAEDLNRDSCAAHLVVDWERDGPEALVAAAEAAGVVPTAVVNFVEPLISWQLAVARHYGLPGGEPGREALLSKARVREELRRIGRSELEFHAGPAAGIAVEAVARYPVIVKPSRDSGGSRLVRRADDAAALAAHLKEIEAVVGPDFELIVEGYLDGREFSVDGPLVAGEFHGLFVVEKTEHDEERHHDAGLNVSPPTSPHVARGAAELTAEITELCHHLGLSQGWLHVEGRAFADGSAELVEINPRPGGGLYRSATMRTCGVDPIELSVLAALGELGPATARGYRRSEELLALYPVDADRPGTLTAATPVEEMLRIPGVVDAYRTMGYRVESFDQENIFAEFLLTAASPAALAEVAERVRAAFRYTFE
ncbi:hypothetical protein CFP65_4035 [Kitasatospora sp. MMS16-BH015]|uniref:ATP-grasp domain-containing protein n=1 Tax=Kitasatospora sp. MMS16-BH015 TaxID=2018025 RepID=UPI000CA15DEF|nr:ATP-grasp domain-containing protein [Kitasatospora sp. MMS16-BH015]AUG78802.1 hypothetical protein CFP65_4035 [Kitasatospora sp. MMS16-BH015]